MPRSRLQIVTPENASSLKPKRRRLPVEPPRSVEEIGIDLREFVRMAEYTAQVVERLAKAARDGDLIAARGIATVASAEIRSLTGMARLAAR